MRLAVRCRLATQQLAVNPVCQAEQALILPVGPHLYITTQAAVAPGIVGFIRQAGITGEDIHGHTVTHPRTVSRYCIEYPLATVRT